MVQYSRSHIKKVNSSFTIEPFKEKRSTGKKETFRLIDVTNLGMYLTVPLLVGIGTGIVFDNKLGTKPLGVICGLLLGFVGSLFNLIKIVKQFSKHA